MKRSVRGAMTLVAVAACLLFALQYVRKVSGYRKPSRLNQTAFDAAVQEVAAATRRMLQQLNSAH